MHVRMGLRYCLLPEGRLAAGRGEDGSLEITDLDRRMTFAYVMNKMVPSVVGPVAEVLVKRLYDLVKG